MFAQNSTELETKQGFKEIKLLNNISSVKTSDINKGNGGARYRYAGESKSLYNVVIEDIWIESDGSNLIREIRLILPTIDDDAFFAFRKKIQDDFGTSCFSYLNKSSGNGTLAWKTDKIYMEFVWEYSSWGKWKPVIILGLLMDLPSDMKKAFENPKDGF